MFRKRLMMRGGSTRHERPRKTAQERGKTKPSLMLILLRLTNQALVTRSSKSQSSMSPTLMTTSWMMSKVLMTMERKTTTSTSIL